MEINSINSHIASELNISSDDLYNIDAKTMSQYLVRCLYQRGVLVINFDRALTWDEIYNFNSYFGIPWTDKNYFWNAEHFLALPSDNSKFITYFSNKSTQSKRFKNMKDELGWHRDCHYFGHGLRFPIRSLYSLKIPDDKIGRTWFCLDRDLYEVLTPEEQEFYSGCSIAIQNVYRPGAPHSVRPLVKKHFWTNKSSLELNSFLCYKQTDLTGGTNTLQDGPFIVKLLKDGQQPSTDHIMNLWKKISNRKTHTYKHTWKPNQIVIWDNTSVLHRRDDISGLNGAERAFIRMNMKHFNPEASI